MVKEIDIRITPEFVNDEIRLKKKIANKLEVHPTELRKIELLKRSIDARKQPVFQLRYRVWVGEKPEDPEIFEPKLQNVSDKPEVVIVGFGPAGMFAALRLIELGYKPIILERGKKVRPRRRDLAELNRIGTVDPNSNYCFGEGGAGTFSDGKLYTRSNKRGNVKRILQLFVHHGATKDILIDAYPHIGTNRLPKIIENIREQIESCGGEIRFGECVSEFVLEDGKIKGVKTGSGIIPARALIVATGHSARDIFQIYKDSNLKIEAKAFSLGLRVEHPQKLIDSIQYQCGPVRPENLPAASYAVVQQVEDRGVYSFCMCPGGIICPSATANDEVVVNGWSPSKRNSPYANSGIVVELMPEDLAPFESHGELAGVAFQKSIEQLAYQLGGGKQVAPAQRLVDFVKDRPSSDLPESSYLPGLMGVEMKELLPEAIRTRLQRAFKLFGRKLNGYYTNDAVVVGVESRTSSPVRIPRDEESLMHPQADGLFPCGEGAGYAGGIMSAAIDGEKVAEMIAVFMEK